jgi:hypothetical protein
MENNSLFFSPHPIASQPLTLTRSRRCRNHCCHHRYHHSRRQHHHRSAQRCLPSLLLLLPLPLPLLLLLLVQMLQRGHCRRHKRPRTPLQAWLVRERRRRVCDHAERHRALTRARVRMLPQL